MDLRLIVSVCVLIHSVFSDQCPRYDSEILKDGQYLPDSSFKQLKDSSLYSCAAACYSHSICRSFNLNKRTRTCFLNVVDRTCPGRSLTSNTDFVYSTITGWHQGIAGPCERTTCLRDQQCHVAPNRSVVCVDSVTEGVDYKLEFLLVKDHDMAWEEAGKYCTDRCGRLPVVNTAEKNGQIASLMTQENTGTVWLGASDRKTEGVWVWIDGQEMGYEDWSSIPNQQPNDWGKGEDCLTRCDTIERHGWNDEDCDVIHYFICEYVITSE